MAKLDTVSNIQRVMETARFEIGVYQILASKRAVATSTRYCMREILRNACKDGWEADFPATGREADSRFRAAVR